MHVHVYCVPITTMSVIIIYNTFLYPYGFIPVNNYYLCRHLNYLVVWMRANGRLARNNINLHNVYLELSPL